MRTVVSLPMRDGNRFLLSFFVVFSFVVSLPMRDGNHMGRRDDAGSVNVVSLPMRDGNAEEHLKKAEEAYSC